MESSYISRSSDGDKWLAEVRDQLNMNSVDFEATRAKAIAAGRGKPSPVSPAKVSEPLKACPKCGDKYICVQVVEEYTKVYDYSGDTYGVTSNKMKGKNSIYRCSSCGYNVTKLIQPTIKIIREIEGE